jgi:lon-related putative ATP-dependent protease
VLDPDPVPVDVKLVLIGERWVHDLLYANDPDFRKLFGVRADFAGDMARTPEAQRRYAEVISAIAAREGLPPVTADGLGALVEEGAALADRRDRLTARFSELGAVLREAAFLARRRGGEAIERRDVDAAQHAREYRDGQFEERLQAMLEEGTLLVATTGRVVGQVNGLSVYDLGYHAFGKPTRITASAAPGRVGIINVEREAQLSGGVYDKGVLIISGYLRRRYADLGSLSLTASLAFEQSYAGVDGDSASIAEVVALLSEISGLPVDQALAITGSINQHGDVQPVGGVTHKLRGFHALCRARGLDGTHGAVLPVQNVRDLMLPREVVEDVRAGRFHVYAVRRVEDALELALDTPMEEIDARVRERLGQFASALREAPAGGDLAPTAAAVAPPTVTLPGAPTG